MTETMHQTHTIAPMMRRDPRGAQFLAPRHERPSDRQHGAMGGQRQSRSGLRVATDPRSCAEPVNQQSAPVFFEDHQGQTPPMAPLLLSLARRPR